MNENMVDISAHRSTGGKLNLRRFHQARWDEPIILELSQPGQRGILVPDVEPEIREQVGDVLATLPSNLRREQPPALPELSQPQVLRHYVHQSGNSIVERFRRSVEILFRGHAHAALEVFSRQGHPRIAMCLEHGNIDEEVGIESGFGYLYGNVIALDRPVRSGVEIDQFDAISFGINLGSEFFNHL